jgi:2-keto-4-pentenoate hydratase
MMPSMPDTASLAAKLEHAWTTRTPIEPLSETEGLEVEQAYQVQRAWHELRLKSGDRLVGRKIGLTSQPVQEQFGVSTPDYGLLWKSRQFEFVNGTLELPANLFIQPRLEGELAFLIGRKLEGPNISLEDVLAATDALAPAVEIVDSRIADYRIKIADTVADNASFGGFAVGAWRKDWLEMDLRLIAMQVHHNAQPSSEGTGAASLGHPANAIAWLVNKLAEYDTGLEPGDIVMSGSLARMLPAKMDDQFLLEFSGAPALRVRFSS